MFVSPQQVFLLLTDACLKHTTFTTFLQLLTNLLVLVLQGRPFCSPASFFFQNERDLRRWGLETKGERESASPIISNVSATQPLPPQRTILCSSHPKEGNRSDLQDVVADSCLRPIPGNRGLSTMPQVSNPCAMYDPMRANFVALHKSRHLMASQTCLEIYGQLAIPTRHILALSGWRWLEIFSWASARNSSSKDRPVDFLRWPEFLELRVHIYLQVLTDLTPDTFSASFSTVTGNYDDGTFLLEAQSPKFGGGSQRMRSILICNR